MVCVRVLLNFLNLFYLFFEIVVNADEDIDYGSTIDGDDDDEHDSGT